MDLLHFVLIGMFLTAMVFVVFFSYRYHSQYHEMLYLRDENARMETYINVLESDNMNMEYDAIISNFDDDEENELPGGAVW